MQIVRLTDWLVFTML